MASWRMGVPRHEQLVPMGDPGQGRVVHRRREADTEVQVLARAEPDL